MIRKASISDADAIADVHVRSWKETYNGLVPSSILAGPSVEGRASWWREALSGSPPPQSLAVFVATNSTDQIVGFGAYGRQRSHELNAAELDGEFQAIYVLSDAQRHGLGTSLMAKMAEHFLASGFRGGGLWVLRENHPAREFYEALNGSVFAEREDQRSSEVVFYEVAYGWNDLATIIERMSRG